MHNEAARERTLNATIPLPFLFLTSLLCGTLIMVLEVLGSRVIGPFFGVSLFVWTSIITVAMIALAAGYAFGGRLSDSRPHPDYLYGIILAAGLIVMIIPLMKGLVLKGCMPFGLRFGAFVSGLILFGPPLFLLGCVSPYVIRIAAQELTRIGRMVGFFYAVSTLGSVAGTILTGFVLVVYVGVNNIFLIVGVLLLLLSVAYFLIYRKRRLLLLALLFPAIVLAVKTTPVKSFYLSSGVKASVLFDKDTHYGNMKVVDYTYGGWHTRELLVDGTVQTGRDMRRRDPVYAYPYLVGILPYSLSPAGKRCLVIGLGGGVVPQWYMNRGIVTDVVDIDPDVVRAAKDYFEFRPNGQVFVEDARYFLSRTVSEYDFVVLDVFSGEAAPAHIMSLESLSLLRSRMSSEGVLAINFIGKLNGDDRMTESVVKTLQQIYANVEIYPMFEPLKDGAIGNMVLVAYNGAERELPADLMAQYEIHPFAVDEVKEAYGRRFRMAENADAIVLSDDYNPIDCYDNDVKEFIRQNVIEETDWRILLGS